MEKFAVDLDKVLDEFELNEDEHENEHYDRLQLEFRRENAMAGSGNNNQLSAGLGTVEGWSEPVHNIPTEVRGLPDGQHDDDDAGAVCRQSLVSITENNNLELDIPNCTPQDCVSEGSNSLGNISKEKNITQENTFYSFPTNRPDVTSDVNSDCEKLWPNIPCQNNFLRDLPSLGIPASKFSSNTSSVKDCQSTSHSSLSLPNLEDQGACSLPLNQSLLPCSLDVLPTDVPSNVGSGSLVIHEGHHPDILDMRQNSQDENSPHRLSFSAESPHMVRQQHEDLEQQHSNSLSENDHLPCSPDIQKEVCLLPDLMPASNIGNISRDMPQISEVSNPAVVTENTLSNLGRNEPAIVQESQSNSRIPELVNIHQSAEQNSNRSDMHFENHCCSSENRSGNPINSLSNQRSDEYFNEFQQARGVSPTAVLPDVSASCKDSKFPANLKHTEDSHMDTDRSDISAIRFNPCANINDEELDAELEELEEEQMRLQGAYGNSGFPPHQETSAATNEANTTSEFTEKIETESSTTEYPLNKEENQGYRDNLENKLDILDLDNKSSCLTAPVNDPDLGIDTTVDDSHPIPSEQVIDSSSQNDMNSQWEAAVNAAAITPVIDSENDYQAKADSSNEVLCENVTIDTLSLTSNVTDVESISSEQPVPSLDQTVPPLPSNEDSSRETPGTLVTAIYDDTGSRDDPSGDSRRESERGLSGVGAVAPFWIPDEEAPNCQECGCKFTVLKRRHHCRGCGRVLCGPCCHSKAPLPYMDYKEARVCATCLHLLTEAEREEEQVGNRQSSRSPNPNNPMEYCSRIPPQQQVGAVGSGPPPTVMVPVGVLKRESSNSGNGSSSRPRGSKQVIFSDGIRPGGDLTELGGQTRPSSPYRNLGRCTRRVVPNIPGNSRVVGSVSVGTRSMEPQNGLEHVQSLASDTRLIPLGGGLPPILMKATTNREYTFDSSPDSVMLEEQLKGDGDPVVFALQKNLTILVKQIKLDCCVGLEVWNVSTRGLCNVGQEEIVILLEVAPGEKSPPPHLFSYIHTVYQQANKGNLVTEMGHTIFTEPEGFLGSKDHGGFLYVRPTYQCLNKLILPPSPYIFAVLIQKWETPWAKVFPLRLMLRLGAEFRYYPCPLVSKRNRKPVYCEIGHTIMNLLVDFRNYAYTIPVIQGFFIHMEDKKTTLIIPRNRYEQVWKALNNSNDHVLALGANFSSQADSHLVTVEDDDGHYTTQAINIQSKPRNVTGASFIVFNGALKSNAGLKAKSSIVEDGFMVQIAGEIMTSLRDALRNMKDFDIPCGPATSQPDELVLIRWVQDDKNFNVGIKSPIDGRQMDGIPSVKIHSGTDYVNNDLLIRWTEMFIIQGETTTGSNDINISRLAECLARACCVALTPHLALLYDKGPNRLALRTTIHQDNVGYEAGMGEARLLPLCMNELDAELIPVIHRAAANITDQAIILELLFHIMEQ